MTREAELPGREALAARVVPSMVFSDGSDSSPTPPPKSKLETDAAKGAQKRFTVRGNAVVTGGAGTLGLQSCDALLEHGLHGLIIFDASPLNAQDKIDDLHRNSLTLQLPQ